MRRWPGLPSRRSRLPDGQRVEIVLDGPQVRLTYRVHLYQDWIESIAFSKEGETIGEWTFSYPKPDEADPHRLTVPSPPHSRGAIARARRPVADALAKDRWHRKKNWPQ